VTPKQRGTIELVAIGAVIATGLLFNREPLLLLPLLFLVIVPFEKIFPRHKGQPVRRPQVGTDIAYLLAGPVLNVMTIGVAMVISIASLIWIPGLLLQPVVGLIPAVALPFVALVLYDITIYWVHRWAHEVPALWRFHAVHHSTEHLDWVSGFRTHPLDGALLAPPFVLLLSAGFDPELTGALAIIQVVVGLFLHANVRWKLRPFHRLIITPEFHHWHHTKDPVAIHSNYAVFLPLWDILFGTYFMPKDRRPSDYGIDEYMPRGIVRQLWYPLRDVPNPLRAFRHPIRALKLVFWFIRTVSGQIYRSTTRRHRNEPIPMVSSGGGFDDHRVELDWPPPSFPVHASGPPPPDQTVQTYWTPPRSEATSG
jgi:sterol desaturase/sphingolipid hydroxylase (fatty acid hydroxylase superfamily)